MPTPRIESAVPSPTDWEAMVNDRIRAKPPTTDVDRWRRGTVRGVEEAGGEVRVTVESEDGDRVAVTVTPAVYDLFAGRVAAGDPVEEQAWFK